MSFAEATALNVQYAPPEVNPFQYTLIRNRTFKQLCHEHAVGPMFNAEYLVWLWNDKKTIQTCDGLIPNRPDAYGLVAWFLEEDAGSDVLWRMLKEQSIRPIQPEHVLVALWREAKNARMAVLRERIAGYYPRESWSSQV
jgi:hypothetical protein